MSRSSRHSSTAVNKWKKLLKKDNLSIEFKHQIVRNIMEKDPCFFNPKPILQPTLELIKPNLLNRIIAFLKSLFKRRKTNVKNQ